MGREVRRVPLDFDWPLRKVWDGYVIPDTIAGHPCPACKDGYTAAGRWVDNIVHLLLMLDDDLDAQRQGRPLHPRLAAIRYGVDQRPSADIRELGTALAGRTGGSFGHDAIDRDHTMQAILRGAGLPEAWGICPNCDGAAWEYDSIEQEQTADAWERTDPPTGEGWQLWETVSEGSPVTPVFASPEALAEHLTTPTLSYEDAFQWVTGVGWAPSGVIDSTGVHPNIEGAVYASRKGGETA